jgi:hypothetical protein
LNTRLGVLTGAPREARTNDTTDVLDADVPVFLYLSDLTQLTGDDDPATRPARTADALSPTAGTAARSPASQPARRSAKASPAFARHQRSYATGVVRGACLAPTALPLIFSVTHRGNPFVFCCDDE